MDKTTLLIPRMSEKAYALSQTSRTYVFTVDKSLNRHDIARAVETQFEVKVANVNLMNVRGKAKRTVRKGGRPVNGRAADFRKAYVTLIEGNSLPIFAAVEEEEAKQEATQEKIDKAATKAAEKEAKADKPAAKKGLLGRKKTAKEEK